MAVEFRTHKQATSAADKLDRLVEMRQRELDALILPVLSDGCAEDIQKAIQTIKRGEAIDRDTLTLSLEIARREIDLARVRFYAKRVRQISESMKRRKKTKRPGKLKK